MQYISPLSLRNISASDMNPRERYKLWIKECQRLGLQKSVRDSNARERYKLWITECERLGLKKSVRALKKKLVESLAQFELLTCNVKRMSREMSRTKQAFLQVRKFTENSLCCLGCVSTQSVTRRELSPGPSVEDMAIANEVHPIEIDGLTHKLCTTCQGVDRVDNNLVRQHQPTLRELTGDGTGFRSLLARI